MEDVNCIICGTSQFISANKVSDRLDSGSAEKFQIVHCICGFIFLNPRPDESEIGQYYNHPDYDPHSGEPGNIFNTIYRLVQSYSFRKKLKLIKKFCGHSGILIDVGGGRGEFCQFMSDSGWKSILQDQSEKALTHAKSIGIKVTKTLENLNPDETIDLFTFWHSLEHIHKISDTLNMVNTILKPNGYVIIAVPNNNAIDKTFYKDNWAPWDAPRHLYHFTKETLTKLLQKHNFNPVYWRSIPQDTPYNILLSMENKGVNSMFKGLFVLLYSWMATYLKGIEYSSSLLVVCKKQ